MWHELLGSETDFFNSLIGADEALATTVRERGCPCGGRLDRADYPRKVRGVPLVWDEAFSRRISFCCAVRGCRKRRTPPSVRFWGRRIYAAAMVIAVSAGWLPRAEVARRTARRWRWFFRRVFVESRFWRAVRARFVPPVEETKLPGSLLERFAGDRAAALRRTLQFLAPATTESARVMMDG